MAPLNHPLRVGLIGCGKMGLQHLKAIKALGNVIVAGVADPLATRESLGELVPADALVVTDPSELLRKGQLDVAHIVTPPHTHAALAMVAIEAGCHVYVEKPFTATAAEAEALLSVAASRGVSVCAGHQYLFERPALLALEALPSLGRLVHVESFFSFRMVRRTITPADQARDILPHAVYPLLQQLRAGTGLVEEPVRVSGIDVRAEGDICVLLRLGNCTGSLFVTLSGRPVEQYQHFIGTNGWMRADYITGGVTKILGPGAGPGVLFTPYRRALQAISVATRGFARLIFRRTTSYPGLTHLFDRFYSSIRAGEPCPLTPRSIVDTVALCEEIGDALAAAERVAEVTDQARLAALESALPPIDPAKPRALVTGGTGLLGRRVVEEMRYAGFPVRSVGRRMPRTAARIPGVEYTAADLGGGVDAALMDGVGIVLHCAAETAGDQRDHERNSILATRHIIEAAARAGIAHVVHISSLAVLKPGSQVRGPLDEATPVDAGNLVRGPYVWGKAESEILAQRLGRELNVAVKVIRPGPLVDYADFNPPGRLGRELGPLFVAIGGRNSPLSVCDVGTAARVIRSYSENFEAAPAMVNLVEAPPPARRELAGRLLAVRPDLKVRWFPGWLLRLLSGPLKLVQRVVLGSAKPIDIYAAFASERYATDAARTVIERAGPSAVLQHRQRAGGV
jgi:predicted dehydrogenase/nucleoside-diphosphate-sugar epimerase